MKPARLAFGCGLASAALLAVLLVLSVVTGVNQQSFELVAELESYRHRLAAGAGPLRAILAIDNVFVATYTATTVFAVQALRGRASSAALGCVMGFVIAAGVLDWIENHHFCTMLASVDEGLPLRAEQAQLQMVASMLKWHLAYGAFFLLGLILPVRAGWEPWMRRALIFVQLPVGVSVYALASTEWADVALWARYLDLGSGFVLLAAYFRVRLDIREPPLEGAPRKIE